MDNVAAIMLACGVFDKKPLPPPDDDDFDLFDMGWRDWLWVFGVVGAMFGGIWFLGNWMYAHGI